ncbi:MAG TPA: ribosome maturation factor RimM, partial [Agromyces mariniharenae]|nr:ribosome maturation factor RimM [Agromyces mariniharenae]
SLQVPESSPWHGKHLTLRELRWYNGHPVGFFDGVDDRDAAEGLVKAILWVDQPVDEAPEPDAWYDHQLVGMAVVRDGVKVGEVVHVDHLPAQDLLIVKTEGREVMVPFVSAIVPEVDIAAGTLTVTPPAGLFEELPEEPEAPAAEGDGEASDAEASAPDVSAADGDAEASDRADDPAE